MKVKGYKNLSLKPPACHPGEETLCADFSLDADVSDLFAYINAVVEKAAYYKNPHCIIFDLDGVKYSLYPDKAMAAPFKERDQAIKSINSLIGFLNDLYERKDTITPDNKTYQPPVPVIEILKLLPKTNCQKCDFPTCMAFAAALSKQDIELSVCEVVKNDQELYSKFQDLGFQ